MKFFSYKDIKKLMADLKAVRRLIYSTNAIAMLFMLLVTLSALVLGIVSQGRALLAGTGGAVAALQLVIAVLLLALSLVLVHEGWQALRRKGRPAAEKA